ncbi:MAG: nucleotidyltransferase domain-containing protein [Pseudanabaena sp.]|jgi:predicted nucleotidyltransferase|nr:nucleotidyltransferase domain-containing protein [Pseudanabaena sp. M090S1SP2A07QC]MCA6507581.1 nucleotidyltransferase domain-containing protein [Pseudanabaena sp. M172S2SP2A07QC]MCA6522714.1 nucleotidyltransferase domain-containing protein [Pseudanabaena sp. M051S1SP2A07QC]MCA6526564.1 nucleotidyltransferase domain-containing protein [Pseudanabaena sp. M179S2SP2A07QC]MCA6529845.1 nucleotidyltransferase domain-containing protein [Pseudanabaena sp. M125S2SP2A07QC]MCA6532630.1 nucleotidyltran
MITNIKNKQLFVLLNELKSGLVELYGDRLFSVILFGSHARGEATSESDIDVMVVLADPVNTVEERSRMSILFWYFLREYDELISIIPMSKSRFLAGEISFLRVVKREGIEI